MLSALRTHLSYANVMATVAVFLALGGGAYALSLPRDSVTSRHIAKGQVKGSDIGKNAVKSAKVADFSLLAKDFRRGQLPEGPQGAPGATKVTVKAANGSGTVTAHCAAGESATGGGADSFEGIVVGEGPTTQPLAFYAPPDQAPFAGYVPTAWSAAAENNTGGPADVTAWVVCAAP